jgi:hypothetical protein
VLRNRKQQGIDETHAEHSAIAELSQAFRMIGKIGMEATAHDARYHAWPKQWQKYEMLVRTAEPIEVARWLSCGWIDPTVVELQVGVQYTPQGDA